MKITTQQLKQIIREELEAINEAGSEEQEMLDLVKEIIKKLPPSKENMPQIASFLNGTFGWDVKMVYTGPLDAVIYTNDEKILNIIDKALGYGNPRLDGYSALQPDTDETRACDGPFYKFEGYLYYQYMRPASDPNIK